MNTDFPMTVQWPKDIPVWYAPSTLLWLVVLIVGPLLLILALRMAYLRAQAILSPVHPPSAENARRQVTGTTLTFPGFGGIVFAFVYGMALGAPGSWSITYQMFKALGPGSHFRLVVTGAGPYLAAMVLVIPSFWLVATTLIVGGLARSYARVSEGTGLLTLLWLIAGSVGSLWPAVFAAGMAAPAILCWMWPALAGTLALSAVVYSQLGRRQGTSVLARVRRAREAYQRESAVQAAADARYEGEYVGPSTLRYWGRIASMFVFPQLFITVFILISGALFALPFGLAMGFGIGSVFALVHWLISMRSARRVRWDRDFVEVTWFRGQPKTFQWQDLAVLRVGEDEDSAWIKAVTGDVFKLSPGRPGYEDLREALAAHVWGRPAAPGERPNPG